MFCETAILKTIAMKLTEYNFLYPFCYLFLQATMSKHYMLIAARGR